jgi:hypothetical protein
MKYNVSRNTHRRVFTVLIVTYPVDIKVFGCSVHEYERLSILSFTSSDRIMVVSYQSTENQPQVDDEGAPFPLSTRAEPRLDSIHSTQVPALLDHIRTLARTPREAVLKHHLRDIKGVVDSMRQDVQLILHNVSRSDLRSIRDQWDSKVLENTLDAAMKNVLEQNLGELHEMFQDGIQDKCKEAAKLVNTSAN